MNRTLEGHAAQEVYGKQHKTKLMLWKLNKGKLVWYRTCHLSSEPYCLGT